MFARINWHPAPRDLRIFGAVILVAFSLIGWWNGSTAIVAGAVIVGVLGLTGTRIALPAYWVWMGIAFVVGNIMSRVLLAIVFFGVMTPIGWAARAVGRDRLTLRKGAATTYWRDLRKATEPESYERQF